MSYLVVRPTNSKLVLKFVVDKKKNLVIDNNKPQNMR